LLIREEKVREVVKSSMKTIAPSRVRRSRRQEAKTMAINYAWKK
jgi:hypothetical protein